MAVFSQAECLSFIKNDTKIPNLYVFSNNFGEKKIRNFYQFGRKWFFSPEFWGASGLENKVDGLPPSAVFHAGIKYTVKLCIDSYWLSVMRWSGQIIWTFSPQSCNSNQDLAIFHPNRTHIRGSKRGSYIQIWSFYGNRKCLKRQFVCFKAEQP